MFREAKLLGISLKQQSRRRVLVVLTFALMAAWIISIALLPGVRAFSLAANFPFLVLIIVMRGIFGSVVQQQVFPNYREGAGRDIMPGLGLARPAVLNPDDADPDEYEVAIRNDAHYRAYRVVAWCSIFLVFAMSWSLDTNRSLGPVVILDVCLFLTGVIFTLPQAIIIWEQPDMTE